MWVDVVDLHGFYSSPLGQTARRTVRQSISRMWPDVSGLHVCGLGYAVPYMNRMRAEAGRITVLMPARQGVMHWPFNEPGLTALVDETEIPLPDNSVDRMLIVHAAESTNKLHPMLREAWRVLAGNGRLLVIVPNRIGLWARIESTPYGYGRPYSPHQLSKVLRDHMFTPLRSDHALYIPPSQSRLLLKLAPVFDKVGMKLFRNMGGVCMIEASKQVYASGPGLRATAKRRAAVTVTQTNRISASAERQPSRPAGY